MQAVNVEGRILESVHWVRAIVRYWIIVVSTLLAGGVGGFFAYHVATPFYQSSVHLIVSGSGDGRPADEVTARVLATQRALALSQIAGTPPAVKAAAAAAGFAGSTPTVTSNADATGPFLSVNVVDTVPARAQAIANQFAATLPATLAKLEGSTYAEIPLASLAPADLPVKPFSPRLKRDLGLGLAAGLVLGVAIALFRMALDPTVRKVAELEKLTELTVLGTVPRDEPKQALPAKTNPRGARAEAYRQVRTTLANAPGPLRTILITSAGEGDGKTSVATNVAMVFSRAGHRVAVIDADLRRPNVGKVFGIDPGVGLTDVLEGRSSLKAAMTQLDQGNLGVLSSGAIPENPSELLGGTRMAETLATLAAEYEFVFVDAPPLLPVADAMVLAPMSDGVVVVVRLGRTTRDEVLRAQSALGRVNAAIIGIVANCAVPGDDSAQSYPYAYASTAAPVPVVTHATPVPMAVPATVTGPAPLLVPIKASIPTKHLMDSRPGPTTGEPGSNGVPAKGPASAGSALKYRQSAGHVEVDLPAHRAASGATHRTPTRHVAGLNRRRPNQ